MPDGSESAFGVMQMIDNGDGDDKIIVCQRSCVNHYNNIEDYPNIF
jgi:inorganic pyrophosphatase